LVRRVTSCLSSPQNREIYIARSPQNGAPAELAASRGLAIGISLLRSKGGFFPGGPRRGSPIKPEGRGFMNFAKEFEPLRLTSFEDLVYNFSHYSGTLSLYASLCR
jgi:hypothetical protein